VGLLDRAVRVGIRRGFRQGLVDGNQVWLALGTAALGMRLLQMVAARRAVVVTERLNPGEALVIRHFLPGEQ
jgi:hypothetical protein